LAPRPRVLLLDEPLSALDAKIRVSLRSEIRAIQRELGITTIFVTHDQEEALSISDQVVVMNKGRAEQAGTPFEIYNAPRTRFVATFVGTLNVLQGIAVDPGKGIMQLGSQTVTLRSPFSLPRGATTTVAVRPENIKLGAPARDAVAFDAQIRDVAFLGSVIRIKASLLDTTVEFDMFNQPGNPPPAPGTMTTVHLDSRDLLLLDA